MTPADHVVPDHVVPDHLVPLAGGWTLWKWVFVRGAGFPARGVLAIAAPRSAKAADELSALDDRIATHRDRLLANLDSVIERLAADAQHAARAVTRKLRRGGSAVSLPELATLDPDATGALVELEHARSVQHAHFEQLFGEETERALEALGEVAREPRFREAVAWQNRAVLRSGVDRLLARPAGRCNVSDRNHAHLVARYLQRYCVKNDSIGFFGPIGWATTTAGSPVTTVQPGTSLLAKRTVYFEHWCIDLLAQQLARDPEVKPYLRPRQMPTIFLVGTTLHYRSKSKPERTSTELPVEYARVLAACDGATSARDIARSVLQQGLDLAGEAEVFELLAELEERGLCTWTFEVPTVTEWPERQLRALLYEVEGAPRARGLAALAELESRRDEVGKTAGDPEALDRAMSELEATFERITQQAATRNSGQTYAARTLVFEECRRDLEIEFGAPLLGRLGPPLQLLLQSARWYTSRVAAHYRAALEQAFDQVPRDAGPATTDYLTYWQHVHELFPTNHRAELVARANEELQRKWTEIIPIGDDRNRVELTCAQLAAAVEAAFAAPHPGWPGARHHSPDLMIEAASADDIRAGRGTYVLGEFHPSVCTLHFFAQKEHDDRAALIRARELDLPEVIPMQVTGKERATRADHMWVSHHDIDIELGTTRSWRPRESVVAVGALVVERESGSLVVRDRGGRWKFDIIEFFGSHLSAQIASGLPMFPARPHMPRISIDDVIVMREQWRFPPEALAFAHDKDPADRFLSARRWASSHAIPRWVFVKVPEEPKPVYVDFASPIYVDMLSKLVRKSSSVTISEMLPAIDQTWLPDAEGRTYASELRVAIVDPVRWQPPLRRSI